LAALVPSVDSLHLPRSQVAVEGQTDKRSLRMAKPTKKRAKRARKGKARKPIPKKGERGAPSGGWGGAPPPGPRRAAGEECEGPVLRQVIGEECEGPPRGVYTWPKPPRSARRRRER